VIDGSGGFNQLHGPIVGGLPDFGKAPADIGVLAGRVFDLIAGDAMPARDPKAAKATVAIENHHWFRWRCADL
jgi:hypothetical protein